MNADTKTLTIGDLAHRARVNIQTIRYYERRGLLPAPERTAANYRIFTEASVRRIHFIKRAQELGFTLTEIRELLALSTSPSCCSADVRDRSAAKLERIDEKIRTLKTMRDALERLIEACSDKGSKTECPILDAMEADA